MTSLQTTTTGVDTEVSVEPVLISLCTGSSDDVTGFVGTIQTAFVGTVRSEMYGITSFLKIKLA